MDTPEYQRSSCTELCPRHGHSGAKCNHCRALDEANAFFPNLLWGLWQYSGVREICALIKPDWEAATNPKPSTFTFWFLGAVGALTSAYVAAFGLASGRYEARLDQIENRANGIYAQSGSRHLKQALERIPSIQKMVLPEKPILSSPLSVFNSLVALPKPGTADIHKGLDVLEDLKSLVESLIRAEEPFERINLCEANLKGADLSHANLKGADLSHANLRRASLYKVNLITAHLREANLSGAQLGRANLSRADLSNANLSRARLNRVHFNAANLRGADLSNAILTEADLSNANLSNANLSNANLRGADLRGADLSRSDLRGARLRGTKPVRLTVSRRPRRRIINQEAQNLTSKQLSVACVDETTILPYYEKTDGIALTLPTLACKHRDRMKSPRQRRRDKPSRRWISCEAHRVANERLPNVRRRWRRPRLRLTPW